MLLLSCGGDVTFFLTTRIEVVHEMLMLHHNKNLIIYEEISMMISVHVL